MRCCASDDFERGRKDDEQRGKSTKPGEAVMSKGSKIKVKYLTYCTERGILDDRMTCSLLVSDLHGLKSKKPTSMIVVTLFFDFLFVF
jgi:hypothetical protein